MRFAKPFRNPSQQLEILRNRGLIITDEARATAYLERIGYYRLSGYWYPFRIVETQSDPTAELIVGDNFKPGVEFRHVVDLYVFDKKLRIAMLDAIERAEIALRTSIALLLGPRDSCAHRNPDLLDGKFSKRIDRTTRKTPHEEWLAKLDDSFARSNEAFATHFRSKYPNDAPPIWIATELWDFGMLSRFYAGMLYKDREMLAQQYGLPNPKMLGAWLKSINLVRNLSAHHCRLWNHPLVRQGMFPATGVIPVLDHLANDTHAQTRLYGTAAAIRFLLLKINPTTNWPVRLKNILATLPNAPSIALSHTGFPANWHTLPLWQAVNNGAAP